MGALNWERLEQGMYYVVSPGTSRVYTIALRNGRWEMFEESKLLGVRDSLEECQQDIEEWDTEPPE